MIAINRLCSGGPRLVALLGFVLVGLGSGCGGSKAMSLTVPLTWKSTEKLDMSAMTGSTPEASVFVAPVVDKRTAKKELIGENLEDADKGVTRPISPEGDVTAFVHDAIKTQFQQAGLKVVDDPGSADRVLTTDLLAFWVEETGTYKGEARATMALNNKAGQQLWKGNVGGTASKWGRSLNAENYIECLSDSTLELIETALKNPSFRKALEKNAMPAAPGAPGAAQPAVPAPGALTTPPPPTPPPSTNQPAPVPGATGGTTSGNPLARPAAPAPAENK